MRASDEVPVAEKLVYPESKQEAVRETLFGVEVADPWRWLEDEEAPEVKAWTGAQDALARGYLAKMAGRDVLAKRFGELYYIDSVSAPSRRGDRFFYSRRHADREKAISYWRAEGGPERVLLDPNTMGGEGENVSLGAVVPSWDGRRVAYKVQVNNADEATLYVMDVDTGEISKGDTIEGAKYSYPQWTPTNDGFYYVWLPTDPSIPTAERPGYAEIRYHKLGTDPSRDPVVHERLNNPKAFLGVDLSRDGRWLMAYVWHGWRASDIYIRDLTSGDASWKPFVVGVDAQFSVMPWKEHFYIVTNDGAPKQRVFKAPAGEPDRGAWREIIPESPDAVLDNVSILGDHLVLTTLRNAYGELLIHDLDGKLVRQAELPAIGAIYGVTGDPEDDTMYFSYNALTIPYRIYKTSVSQGGATVWASVDVDVDPDPYKVEQVWYTSRDGTRVSMFVVTHKDAPRDGSTPFLMYGYGGFSVNMKPYFRAGIFPWLEAGGGYALPNLRGGGEYGEEWHRAGMLTQKQNVFDDFIAAAEHLIAEGYTSSERLAIRGGSNGGLLVGAAVTQRPDLFGAVVCAAPLLDMVRYHLFGSGKTWIPEYGSADDEEQFKALLAYSPYHNVKPGETYPPFLMLSPEHDDRVDPLHARKMVAALQSATDGGGPILLRVEKDAGHGGADRVRQYVEEGADVYAFLMHHFGMTPR